MLIYRIWQFGPGRADFANVPDQFHDSKLIQQENDLG